MPRVWTSALPFLLAALAVGTLEGQSAVDCQVGSRYEPLAALIEAYSNVAWQTIDGSQPSYVMQGWQGDASCLGRH